MNSIGEGERSSLEFVVPDKPGVPINVSARAIRRGAVVSWGDAPDNGSAITGYRVTNLQTGKQFNVGSDASKLKLLNLKKGARYRFAVAAKNEMGFGATGTSGVTRPL